MVFELGDFFLFSTTHCIMNGRCQMPESLLGRQMLKDMSLSLHGFSPPVGTMNLFTYPLRDRVGLFSYIAHSKGILVSVITELSHAGSLRLSQTVTIIFIMVMDRKLVHHLFAAIFCTFTAIFRLDCRRQ